MCRPWRSHMLPFLLKSTNSLSCIIKGKPLQHVCNCWSIKYNHWGINFLHIMVSNIPFFKVFTNSDKPNNLEVLSWFSGSLNATSFIFSLCIWITAGFMNFDSSFFKDLSLGYAEYGSSHRRSKLKVVNAGKFAWKKSNWISNIGYSHNFLSHMNLASVISCDLKYEMLAANICKILSTAFQIDSTLHWCAW